MMPVTLTTTSVAATRAVNLNWLGGKPAGVSVTGSSSGTFGYTIQYTLDDILTTASTLVVWVNDPNATALSANSSTIFLYQMPLGGIRLNSTAVSSATLTFKVNQGEGWALLFSVLAGSALSHIGGIGQIIC